MGACYGDGILGFVPLDEEMEGEAGKIAFLERFAALGLSHRFREIVGEKVAEFALSKGAVSWRWLPEDEAAPVLAAERQVGGSAPYSLFPTVLDYQLYIPGCRSQYGGIVQMPGSAIHEWGFRPMRYAIAALEERIAEGYEDDDARDFAERLLAQLRVCSEHRLIFTIGY